MYYVVDNLLIEFVDSESDLYIIVSNACNML